GAEDRAGAIALARLFYTLAVADYGQQGQAQCHRKDEHEGSVGLSLAQIFLERSSCYPRGDVVNTVGDCSSCLSVLDALGGPGQSKAIAAIAAKARHKRGNLLARKGLKLQAVLDFE
ncbi:unnamed protein product, partial [Chrysoparadoxa australica]